MLRRLTIEDFKSFRQATVSFGSFTLLVGANASGKSNIREALRFLHGVARGYTLAEVLGEKWGRGGELEWNGLRGGAAQALRRGAERFVVGVDFTVEVTTSGRPATVEVSYEIGVQVRDGGLPILASERLSVGRFGYDTHPDGVARPSPGDRVIVARMRQGTKGAPPDATFVRDRPVLRQLDDADLPGPMRRHVERVVAFLGSMRFLDLDPELARRSSARGVTTLGDRGQNLSSVLASLSDDPAVLDGVRGWIRALTPMDAVAIEFETDLNNQTLAVLVEGSGERTPLSSASDGTVRFLAIVALLFAPTPPSLIFIEEIENGIHPHRMSLLLDLLEQRSGDGHAQVVATSHSPQLLEGTWATALTRPVLVTRPSGNGSIAVDLKDDAELRRVLDGDGDAGTVADLMSDGWFEDVAELVLSAEDHR